ncbi:FRG domain-containing protein [Rahnella inusitata]|uniref:FRG domain-containing protein n=1 Tax=Rahnella TaxID=34037 RepID=UPI0039AFBD22
MYNIIKENHNPLWNVKEGDEASSNYPLSRFLESTPSRLAERLRPVTDSTLMYLAGTTVLFVSKVYAKLTNNGGRLYYIDIRVGLINRLKLENKFIHYEFTLLHDFGNIEVSNTGLIRRALEPDVTTSVSNRSHWAIKDGNVSDAIKKINKGLTSPIVIPLDVVITQTKLGAIGAFQQRNKSIESLQEYLDFILEDEPDNEFEIFYRGHSDQKYLLEPSILRKDKASGNYTHYFNEKEMISEMLTVQPGEFASDKYMLDKLVRMQHFGLPTRLLDLTYNPLVALYFACENHEKIDGEVIILKTKKTSVKFFDSDTVSCIANLCKLDDPQKEELANDIENAIRSGNELPIGFDDPNDDYNDFRLVESRTKAMLNFNIRNICGHLLHSIKDEKPYFKDIINPYDLSRVIFVRGRISNTRISSQSGAFLLFGLDAALQETGDDDISITRVTIRNKKEILKKLKILNIHASTIYPGLENSAEDIKNKYHKR